MLATGKSRPGELRYAGFGIRLGAKMLDGLILGVVGLILSFVLGLAIPRTSPELVLVASAITFLVQIGMYAGYSGYFLSTKQATPGKMACGLAVVTPEGGSISFSRGVGRYFGELLSSLTLSVGYLMVLFDAEKRSLHDRICNTRVIYK